VQKGCRKGAERVQKGCRKGAERVQKGCRKGAERSSTTIAVYIVIILQTAINKYLKTALLINIFTQNSI
jgi:hypothetical protein